LAALEKKYGITALLRETMLGQTRREGWKVHHQEFAGPCPAILQVVVGKGRLAKPRNFARGETT
jgi:hypothetical protein